MKKIKILFTGVGRRVELLQAFRNAALVQEKELVIYGADMADTAPALIYCDYIRIVCGMQEARYIDDLVKICYEDHIDLLIPTIDTDLLVLAENRKKFEEVGTKVLISSIDMVYICRDKHKTSKFFMGCGLKAPVSVNDWKEYSEGYPAFIKPRDGSSSINAFKVKDEKELEIYATQLGDYVVQPFIEGKEYTIDIFCDFDGIPISIIPRERMQVRAGEVLKTRIVMDETMINEVRELCKVFKPCGPITVQLIRDYNTKANYYIEINPRFGGGAPLSMKAGARSAEAILKLLVGENVEYIEEVEDGAIYSRYDQSICISEGRGKVKGIIFDLDDTLYSEKEYVKSGYEAVSRHLGDVRYLERMWHFFETGKLAIDELLKELGREQEKAMLLEIYRSHNPQIHLYSGVAEMLDDLKQKGIKIGIITDGRVEGQRNKINALGLKKMVDDIIITDELGGIQFRKPCDIAFRILQNLWRLPTSEMVYVGDNLVKDFQAPRQLGMRSIWFNNENGLYTYNDTVELESISSILEIRKLIGS